jgi:stage II sporulation protein D
VVLSLILLVLHSTPLEVRVLERERPTAMKLEAEKLACDDAAITSPVQVTLKEGSVRVGKKTCSTLVATGNATVELAKLRRSFPGELRVTVQGSTLRLLNVVDVEAYLPSVVEAEADGFPAPALEAQAVVARTFAVTAKRHRDFALCDLAHCQVYRGATANEAARKAVQATANQLVLPAEGAALPTYFHASCGGHTSAAKDVFGEVAAGSSVADASCAAQTWTFSAPKSKWAAAFDVKARGAALEVVRKDAGGRVLEVRVFGKKMSGDTFLSLAERAFGWRSIQSARFTFAETRNTISLNGSGTGHGVGFCQIGARDLARRGASADEILQHYFPESHVGP